MFDVKTENIEDSDQDSQMEQEQHLSNNEQEFEVENFNFSDYLKKFDATTTANSAQNTTETTEEPVKKKKFDKELIIQEACEEMTKMLRDAKHHFTPPTSTQTFFNSVAIQVVEAKLNPVDLMRLQQRVLEVVTQEILNYQQNTVYEEV